MQAFKKTKIFFTLFFLTSLLSIDGRADCPDGTLVCQKVVTNPDNSVSLYYQGTIHNLACCGKGILHTDCEPCDDINDKCNSTFPGCEGQCNDFNSASCDFIKNEKI